MSQWNSENKTSYSIFGPQLDVVAPSSSDLTHLVGSNTCPGNGNKIEDWDARGDIWTTDIPALGGYNKSKNFCPEPHIRYVQDEDDTSGDYTGHFGGTSATCPQVAGLAALILAVNDDLNYSQPPPAKPVAWLPLKGATTRSPTRRYL